MEANLCFSIFGKNLKIQNGSHFWGEQNCLKIAKSTLIRYPVGRKFQRNRSLSRTVKEIEANLGFSIFGENSKWPPFWGREMFFKNCQWYIS